MDKNKKKELLEIYKNSRPEMGIIYFECLINHNKYVGISHNTKSSINSLKTKLNNKMYIINSRNGNLQKDWTDFGEMNFQIKVLDTLDYDKDMDKKDYTDELKLLLDEWIEKFEKVEEIK